MIIYAIPKTDPPKLVHTTLWDFFGGKTYHHKLDNILELFYQLINNDGVVTRTGFTSELVQEIELLDPPPSQDDISLRTIKHLSISVYSTLGNYQGYYPDGQAFDLRMTHIGRVTPQGFNEDGSITMKKFPRSHIAIVKSLPYQKKNITA